MVNFPYTILTFSPVQEFIEKSRKLRDLYGSSFLLSYLARSLCDLAESKNMQVVTPVPTVTLTQGITNQIIVKGDLPKEEARMHLQAAWSHVVVTCKEAIDSNEHRWDRAWTNWQNHCWEFFWAQSDPGGSITQARQRMNEVKRVRDWTAINWIGESSTLSGADAIAWPGMLDQTHPKPSKKHQSAHQIKSDIDDFYVKLSNSWGEKFFDADERLNIPELVKRLVTHGNVADRLNREGKDFPIIDLLKNFNELNRHDTNSWTGWFQGDGDSIGKFLMSRSRDDSSPDAEENALKPFSEAMVEWGNNFRRRVNNSGLGRIVYAGGDDFLGVLYPRDDESLTLQDCLEQWIYRFSSEWQKQQQPITASVGFVWAAPRVPQRDVLQHCKLAEKMAKSKGRDRITIRVLFNGGNFLDWTCPWRFVEPILTSYRDREGRTNQPNWNHLNEDIQALAARHVFDQQSSRIAQELFEIYFPNCPVADSILNRSYWFNPSTLTFELDKPYPSGILGNQENVDYPDAAFNQWFISLARIGIHLFKAPKAQLTVV